MTKVRSEKQQLHMAKMRAAIRDPNATKLRKPIRTSIPAVRSMMELVDASGLSYRQIAEKAGIERDLFTRYRNGSVEPRLATIEAVLDIFGHELTVKEKT